MNILSKKPLTMAEAKSYVNSFEDKKQLEDYFKTFIKLKKDKAEHLLKELHELKNAKLKEEHIVKIIDFLPLDAEDLNKITYDISLTEDEANKILEIVRKY